MFNFFWFVWNWKWSLPQERASFSKLKSLCICIFSIISKKVIANLEVPPLTFQGVIFRKVLGIELFYFNQLVFRGKQPYILNLVEIRVVVVNSLVDLTENYPIWKIVVQWPVKTDLIFFTKSIGVEVIWLGIYIFVYVHLYICVRG